MKTILKEYITSLRETKRLEERRKELVNQLIHLPISNEKEFGEIVFNDRVHAKEIIIENLPNDTTDEEAYCKMSSLCDELYYIQIEEEIKTGRYIPEPKDYVYQSQKDVLLKNLHESW